MKRRRFLQATASAPALILGGCKAQTIPGSIVGGAQRTGHILRQGGPLPTHSRTEKTDVLILGAGIAGLAAARQLNSGKHSDFLVLDLEGQPGGNSQGGSNEVAAYPWGAHYVPLPGPDCREVREFFGEIGLIKGHDAAGRPIYDELSLCADPQERIFIHGQWEEGIVPNVGLTETELAQFQSFNAEMDRWRAAKGADGLPAFTLPADRSSRDPDLLALDSQTMGDWMTAKGWTCEPLRWLVDYSCRDDFGGTVDQVSAWAGIHYFASRHSDAANADRETMLTWPEGNAWLVKKLAEHTTDRIRTHTLVLRTTTEGRQVHVDALDVRTGETTRITAKAVVCALPRFIAQRVIGGLQPLPGLLTYSPWVVANLTLDELPPSPGALPAWDSVVYRGPSLGYVNASHQSLHPVPRRTVITQYDTLCDAPPAKSREWMLTQTHEQWCERVFRSLAAPHPNLRQHTQQLDIWLWGHGMIRPEPGFITGTTRAAMQNHQPPVFFAHSDMSGLSLFEEAYTRGVHAASALTQWLT